MTRALVREIAAGVVVTLGGLGFSFASLEYGLGSMIDMEPGMFPFLIGLLIALTGVMILIAGLADPTLRRETKHIALSTTEWLDQMRAFIVVVVGLLAFGLLVRPFGLVPAVVALVLVVGLAEHERKPLQTVLTAAGLAALATAIFIFGLGMNIQIATWGL